MDSFCTLIVGAEWLQYGGGRYSAEATSEEVMVCAVGVKGGTAL